MTLLRHSLSAIFSRWESSPIIICGDFNVPSINWTSITPSVATAPATDLCDMVNDNSLHQLVTTPTREQNILDLVLTNIPCNVGQVSVTEGIHGSDHEAVSFILKLASTRPNIPRRTVFNYKRADFAKLRETLSDIPWDICFLTNSVDDAWVKFKDLLLISADQWVPKLVLKNSTWLAQETIVMIRRKHRAYLKAKRTSRLDSIQEP